MQLQVTKWYLLYLAATIEFTVACSCGLNLPDDPSRLPETCGEYRNTSDQKERMGN